MSNINGYSDEYIFCAVLFSNNTNCYILRAVEHISYIRARECVFLIFEKI